MEKTRGGAGAGSQTQSVKYVCIGTLTRDSQIDSNGNMLFGSDGLGVLGGGGPYAAAGAHLWDHNIGMVGCKAEGLPDPWIEEINSYGIDLRGLQHAVGVPVEKVFSQWSPDGSRAPYDPTRVFPANNIHLLDDVKQWMALKREEQVELILRASPNPEDIPADYLEAAAFHVSAYPLGSQSVVVERVRDCPAVIALDFPGPLVNKIRTDELAPLLNQVDVFLPSDVEIRNLCGGSEDTLEDWARRFADMGPEVVVIRMGKQGSLIYEREIAKFHAVPIFPAKTCDPTGAGDAYCAGFMVGYQETGDPYMAGLYGSVSASFVVEGYGAPYALGFSRNDAMKRLQWLKQHMQEDT
jgi:sugar/nucleoside kinase (ribokinase family)